MKKNGFITSALLYGMLALFIVLMLSCLAILANRKISMDKLKSTALNSVKLDFGSENMSAKDEIVDKVDETGKNEEEGIIEDTNIPDSEEGEEGKRYIYVGAIPKNYIWFNEELWRIMAIEPDGKLKIIRDDLLAAGVAFDSINSRNSEYCYGSAGCNIWGSSSNMYDKDGNFITVLPLKVGGTAYALPEQDSTLNIHLNNDYYNGLKQSAKSLMTEGEFYVGAVAIDDTKAQTLAEDVEQASSVRWQGKVGLIDVTEYVKASTYEGCKSFNDGSRLVDTGTPCKQDNYLYVPADSSGSRTWQVITPAIQKNTASDNLVYSVRPGTNGNDGYIAAVEARYPASLRPVVYLTANIRIVKGDGTKDNPYEVELVS